jgi:hypothetical protein
MVITIMIIFIMKIIDLVTIITNSIIMIITLDGLCISATRTRSLLFAAILGPGCLRKTPGHIVIAARETRQLAHSEGFQFLLYSVVTLDILCV